MKRIKLEAYNSFDGEDLSYPIGFKMEQAKDYVQSAINSFAKIYNNIALEKVHHVNLICRGSSGAILAALFSAFANPEWDCRIVHVKKPGESSHGIPIRNCDLAGINVIIDDFLCSGRTLVSIIDDINDTDTMAEIDVVILASASDRINEVTSNADIKYLIVGNINH